ncbi:hypothetical protein ACQ4PT_005595 [Festuca glaucescens]
MATRFPKEGGSSSAKPPVDLQLLMKKLVLKDEELDDVVLPREEVVTLRENARWMAVVKVHTSNPFGNQPFFQKMDAAWGFAKKWSIRPAKENLFILQVSCIGDWNRALLEGPWIFRQMGVMIAPYDGIADPESVMLNRIHVWVQIRGIPPLFRKEEIVKDMAARIGEVLGTDMFALGASGTSFVRVRVKIDVFKPLTRVVGLHPEGQEKLHFQVLFEKLPRFCDVFGLLGHGELECRDGVHGDNDKQYGDWLVAPVEDRHPLTSGVKNKGQSWDSTRGGRGGGRGHGRTSESRKRSSGEAVNQEVGVKPPVLATEVPQLTDGNGAGEKGEQQEGVGALALTTDKGGKGALPPSPVKPPLPKKQRKTDQNSSTAGSASERRQEQ